MAIQGNVSKMRQFLRCSLLVCALNFLVSTHWVSAQATGVSVRLVGGFSENEGRVEVNYQGQWGTVCDDGWDLDDGNVVCRMLDLALATRAWGGSHFGQGSGPIALDDVSCYGNESNIADCQHQAWFSHNCGHSEDAGVTCGEAMTTPAPVRLVGGAFNEGRVEVYYQGQWGTVCDDGWDLNDANVVCRMLGSPPATRAWGNAHFGQGAGRIALDYVSCNGNEASIADCRHRAWFTHNCGHYEDAGVTCGETMTTPGPVSVRLVGGASSYEGRVEVYYQGQWGTVCDDHWDLDDANVVCRMLDLPPASNAWDNARFGQGSGPIALDDVNCFGYESSLGQCQHQDWFNHDCVHGEDAGVTCSEYMATMPPGKIDLSNIHLDGNLATKGIVQGWKNGQFVDVCSDDWDLNDAKVIRRQLGYSTSDVSVYSDTNHNDSPSHESYSIYCDGHESRLIQCYTTSYTSYSYCIRGIVSCKIHEGLSDGAVAGIAVGSVLTVFGLLIVFIVAFVKCCGRKPPKITNNTDAHLTTVGDPNSAGTGAFNNPVYVDTSLAQPMVLQPPPGYYSTPFSNQTKPIPSQAWA